ncbi:hypothetical protein R80B4_00404 [Fibrobacteres bacterium R8-0-B4]
MSMMKTYYATFMRVLPIMLLLLIVPTIIVAAGPEVPKDIVVADPVPITIPKTVDWDYKPILIAWAAAIAIGIGVVEFWKYKMNTVFLKHEADTYVVPDSLKFNVKTDSFLYSHVTKTRRQTQNRSR